MSQIFRINVKRYLRFGDNIGLTWGFFFCSAAVDFKAPAFQEVFRFSFLG